MNIFEQRLAFQARIALFISVACAGALACGGDDATPAPTGGSGGATGTGGSAGAGGLGGAAGTGLAGAGGSGNLPMCGGFLGTQCPSPDSQYCDYEKDAVCGASDGSGVCRDRPSACTKECTMVCGCDGTLYCNACEANRAGIDDSPSFGCRDASVR